MKLASLRSGGRDGTLILVDRALQNAVAVGAAAPTLQAALDDWARVAPQLAHLSDELNAGRRPDAFPIDIATLGAPLPRAYQWSDGSAYLSHAELVRKARNAAMPANLYHDPLMYQGTGDVLNGPRDPILMADEAWGIDLEAEVAVVTDDVPMGISTDRARSHIKLIGILNDVSLRNLIPGELAKGFGFFHAKPTTAFAGVLVTPDELGSAWDGAKVSLPLVSHVNGELLGKPDAGVDLDFDFPALIAHAAKTRPLGAGTIIGSGTVSNRDRAVGSSCLAEKRMIEIIDTGAAKTPFLKFGDVVRIEMFDRAGHSIFGAIEQRVERYDPPR